jgi:hypothetical protein
MSCLTMDKQQAIKSTPFANSVQGFVWLFERLAGLGVTPKQILVGLEATSRDARESVAGLAQAWLPGVPVTSGSDACLRSTTEVASENGSARCGHDCASTARDGEARFGYVPSEQVATYRELMRLQHQREPMTWCATKMRSTPCSWSCFPNSRRSLYDPTRPTALAVLKRYPSAQAIAQTEVESRSRVLA